MRELPSIDELFDLLDVLRENGYEGTYEEMKYKLINDPAALPFPDKLVFSRGGFVNSLLNAGIGKLFKENI